MSNHIRSYNLGYGFHIYSFPTIVNMASYVSLSTCVKGDLLYYG